MFLYLYYILLPVTCIYFIIPGRNIGMYLVDSGLTVRNPANVGLSSIPCPLTRNPGRNRVKMIPGPEHPGLSLNLQYLGSSPVWCQIRTHTDPMPSLRTVDESTIISVSTLNFVECVCRQILGLAGLEQWPYRIFDRISRALEPNMQCWYLCSMYRSLIRFSCPWLGLTPCFKDLQV